MENLVEEIIVEALYQGIRSGEPITLFTIRSLETYLVSYHLFLQHAQAEEINRLED